MRREMPVRSTTDKWIAEKTGIALDELDQSTLEAWQMEAFRRTLSYAQQHSRFYSEYLSGVEPESIKTPENIQALPFTSEKDLAENEWIFQCVSPRDVSRVVTVPTTGTTGKSKRISFTEEDQLCAREYIFNGFLTMCRPGDRMLVMMSGGTVGSIGDSVDKAMQRLEITTEVHGPVTDIAAAWQHIMDFKPNVIVAIPSHMAAVARYGSQFGNPEREFINSVLLSADDVPESICQRLYRFWDCYVFRCYGMTEMCISGGVECIAHDGYHLREADLYFEIVDEDEDGWGEIVFTTLDRKAMPLIRYRTGDIGRFSRGSCICSSPLRRIEHIRGRKKNRIMLDGAYVYLSDILNEVFSIPEAIDCECEVDKDGKVFLTIGVLPGQRPDLSAANLSACIKVKEMSAFEEEYNSKKKIIFL